MPVERRFELLSLPGWTRAESLKMLFYLADQPFFDHRITIGEWKAYKNKSKFNESDSNFLVVLVCLPPEVRLPILRDGQNCTIVGTLEIARFLSRRFGKELLCWGSWKSLFEFFEAIRLN